MEHKKKKTQVARKKKITITEKKKLKAMPGGSSTGKYKNISSFAGKSGGTSPYSFPIDTLARARNALARAHFAPNPSGIKAAVYLKYPQLKKRHMKREGK